MYTFSLVPAYSLTLTCAVIVLVVQQDIPIYNSIFLLEINWLFFNEYIHKLINTQINKPLVNKNEN